MKKKDIQSVPHSIDEYLLDVGEKEQIVLEKLRKQIHAAAPGAEETISYQIPTFKLNGSLVGFAAFKKHCSFFVMNNTLIASMKDELKGYDTDKGTIRFSPEKPLPAALVKKLVRARVKENAEIMKARKKA